MGNYQSVHAAKVGTASVHSQNLALQVQPETNGEGTTGQPNVIFESVVGNSGNPTFSTRDIKDRPRRDYVRRGGPLREAVDALYQRVDRRGSWGSGGRSVAVATGVIYPTALRCDHKGDATLDVTAVVTSSDGNSPFVFSTSVTVANDNVRWTIPASFTWCGVTVGQIKSIEIDFGITVETEGDGSALWPSIAHIGQRHPKFTVTTTNLALISSFSGRTGRPDPLRWDSATGPTRGRSERAR